MPVPLVLYGTVWANVSRAAALSATSRIAVDSIVNRLMVILSFLVENEKLALTSNKGFRREEMEIAARLSNADANPPSSGAVTRDQSEERERVLTGISGPYRKSAFLLPPMCMQTGS